MYPQVHSSTIKIAKTWKQSKCPLTDEWIKMWYTYTMEYYSDIKNNEIIPCATTQMDLDITTVNEVRKRKANTIWYNLWYVESKIQLQFSYLQNRYRLTENREQTVVAKREWDGSGWIKRLGLAGANHYTYDG